jgi:TonB family protein
MQRMLLRAWSICLLFAILGGVAKADPRTPPPLSAAAPTESRECSKAIGKLLNLDGTEGLARDYAVALHEAGDLPGGTESGTLAFYIGNDLYAASFRNVAVAAWAQSLNEATPIVIQFPSAVHIDAAYVASLGAVTPAPCDIGYVWHDSGSTNLEAESVLNVQPPFDIARFEQLAQTLPPTPATLTAREPVPSCDTPNAIPLPVNLESPIYPADARKAKWHGTYRVALTLDTHGAVTWTRLFAASARHAELEALAVQAAWDSTFQPEIFRCNAVPGIYLFQVEL